MADAKDVHTQVVEARAQLKEKIQRLGQAQRDLASAEEGLSRAKATFDKAHQAAVLDLEQMADEAQKAML